METANSLGQGVNIRERYASTHATESYAQTVKGQRDRRRY